VGDRPIRRIAARAATWLVNGLLIIVVAGLLALQVGPRVLPYRVFEVLSGSMTPTIPVGAEVIDRVVPGDSLRVGDVITYEHPERPGTYITHRVVGIDRTGLAPTLATRGDANGASDPWRVPLQGSMLRVVAHIPLLGYLLGYLGSPLARLAMVALVAAGALFFVAELWLKR
jgi:signal peptidase